jgi:two-component system, cell cycle response regulator DivK
VIRILLVEDNELNRDMLSRRLQRRGYDVVLAVDGQEAITTAETSKPDVILMDMDLPVLNGWEATRALRNNPAIRDIPVIALTAHALPADRERAIEAGCDAYQSKPVDFPELVSKIEQLTEGRVANEN